jgi:hypothetical protein
METAAEPQGKLVLLGGGASCSARSPVCQRHALCQLCHLPGSCFHLAFEGGSRLRVGNMEAHSVVRHGAAYNTQPSTRPRHAASNASLCIC